MEINDYFNRILPIVGDSLRKKKVAIFCPENSCLIADALARCGLTQQLYFHSREISVNSPLTWFYDKKPKIKNSGEYLRDEIISHNHLEKNWEIEISNSITNQEIEEEVKNHKIDLIIALGEKRIVLQANQIAEKLKIKAVTGLILKDHAIDSLIFIKHPKLKQSFNFFSGLISENNCYKDNFPFFSWLGAMDLLLNSVKSLLLENTKYQRKDFNLLILENERSLILRGSNDWPYWVNYLNPSNTESIKTFLKEEKKENNQFFDDLKEKKVLMIGSGTASLLTRQILNFVNNLYIIDYKEFNIFNPVRQLVGTKWLTNEKKPFVLKKYLEKRLGENNILIEAKDLKISADKPSSITCFEEILDDYQPDLVIVSMGKTYDDNFSVCEILKKRGIKHIVPSAFPGASHYKVIAVDEYSPCYECLQNNLRVDVGPGHSLNDEVQAMLYTSPDDPTQPATIFETWPSTFLSLRLCLELLSSFENRSGWFNEIMVSENCLVGANQIEKNGESYVYGTFLPGQVVTYGILDFIGQDDIAHCNVCNRSYFIQHKI